MSVDPKKLSHDGFTKHMLRRLRAVRDMLKKHVPPDLVVQIDWEALRPYKTEFVGQKHKSSCADLAYMAKLFSGRTVLFVVEHKSYPDKKTGMQLYRYQNNMLLEYYDQNQSVPLIIPIILYHGKPGFKADTLYHLYGDDVELMKQYHGEPIVIDVCCLSDEEIFEHGHAAPTLYMLKHVREKDDETFLSEVFINLLAQMHACRELEDIRSMLHYRFRHKLNGPGADYVRDLIEKSPSYLGDIAMNAYQEIIEIGQQRGIEQGIEQGVQETSLVHARRMLSQGLSVQFAKNIVSLEPEAWDALEREIEEAN